MIDTHCIRSAAAAFLIGGCWLNVASAQLPLAAPLAPPSLETMQQLSAADAETRAAAARKLSMMGPAALPAVPKLVERLSDESPEVRAYAAYALGMVGPGATPAFPEIAKLVKDPDANVRREAVKALMRLKVDRDQLIPVMVEVLETSTSEEVVPAMHAIAAEGKEAVPALIAALEHDEAKYWVCQILSQIGPDAAQAAPAVAKVLDDSRPEVKREAVLCLGHLGAAAQSSTPAVIEQIGSADPGTRAAAIWAAVMMGADADMLRPKLESAVTDADPLVDVVAAWGLAKLAPGDEAARSKAITVAIAGLKNEHAPVRGAAARALVDLKVTSETDPQAVEALIQALANHDDAVGPVVMQAFLDAGETGVPRLIKGLDRPEVRGFACMVLMQLGPKGKAAKDALVPLTKAEDQHTRAAAVAALAAVAGDDADVVAATAAALDDPSGEVRFAAADALGRIGDAAKSAAPALEKHAADADPVVKEAVARALKAING